MSGAQARTFYNGESGQSHHRYSKGTKSVISKSNHMKYKLNQVEELDFRDTKRGERRESMKQILKLETQSKAKISAEIDQDDEDQSEIGNLYIDNLDMYHDMLTNKQTGDHPNKKRPQPSANSRKTSLKGSDRVSSQVSDAFNVKIK